APRPGRHGSHPAGQPRPTGPWDPNPDTEPNGNRENEEPRTCVRGRSISRFYVIAQALQSRDAAEPRFSVRRLTGMGHDPRRGFALAALGLFLVVPPGCDLPARSAPERVWGLHGVKPGHVYKPRAAAFDAQDHLFLADLTDRIQVFDRDGQYLLGWR